MAPTQRPLGAQMSHALHARGVDVIFGIPGVHNIELYRGIEEAGIAHILARHEQGAGFMADGYARATGKPGVAYVITGPGLCNIMTAMGQAYSDSVPMLVISSCLARKDRSMGRGRLHEMLDQEGAAATVCEWSMTAPDAPAAYTMIDRAFAEFASQRPRPKHIQVPIDVLGAMATAAPAPRPSPNKPHASSAQAAEVAAHLKAAKRPMFLFGGGAKLAYRAARDVVALSGAAVFQTYAGKGVISGDYALNYGNYLSRPATIDVIASADLLVVVGSTLSECDLWRDDLGHTAPMIRIDIDPVNLSGGDKADTPILADADAFLQDVAQHLQGHRATTTWSAKDVSAAKIAYRASSDSDRPGIARILDALAEVLDQETTIVSDMTQFAYVGKEVFPQNLPNKWHHPYGFGTLGYGLPAAIGAKIGLGDQNVLCIAGDYGFHYTMQELGVAVELGLNIPIILWNNDKLKEIESSMVKSQIAPNAVTALNPDFCKLAEAFGANATKPATLKDFQVAITQAFTATGPTLIEVTPDIL